MLLKIVQYPDLILKKISQPVVAIDHEIRTLIDNMFETMYAAPGVGLAGVQVGVLKRILIIDIGKITDEQRRPDPLVMINPKIKLAEGEIQWEEGCLSLPEFTLPMIRSKKLLIEGLGRNGKPIKILGEDLLAVAFQHEIDHLDGKLLVDRISRLKRDLYKKHLKKMVQDGHIEKGTGPVYLG